MKKPARLTAAFAFVLAAALSAWADYSPLKVGNVWVYQGRTMAGMAMYNPYKVTFDETLTLKVVSRQVYPDSTRWMVSFKDSLSHRIAFMQAAGDSAVLPDTVLKSTLTFTEIGDSIILVSPRQLELDRNFYLASLPRLLVLNDFFRFHSKPAEYSTEVSGAQGGLTVREAFYSTNENFQSWASAWFVDDVGLYWLHRSPSSPGCDNHKRELLLTAFNGRSIDPGIRPPGAILAKEAKIACAVRHPGAVLAFGRAVRGGVGLDMLGRALGLAPQRVPKVPD